MQQTPEQFQQKIEAMILPIAQKLGTSEGFFLYWFQILPKCKNQKAAFDLANLLHFKIFKKEKYSSFDSFRKQRDSYIKTYKK
jgi:hypothetical protein